MIRAAKILVVCPFLMIAPPPAAAQAAFRVADFGEHADLVVDGQFEARWQDAPVIDEFVEYRPRQGAPASVRTEVRLARDSLNLYVMARMFDPDISRLRSGLARRDSFSNEQDWISLALDPVGKRRVAQLLYFNADGVVWDGLSNEDAGTSTPFADFEVDVATSVQADCWIVELRLPFEEIRYATKTPETWHLLLRRNYPREERHAMAAPAIPANAPCFMCLAAPLQPGELPSPTGVSLVPQAVALGRRHTGEGEWRGEFEPSLDAKWRMSPSTVFDVALNPDFSQVDLDTPQLSSNRQFAVSIPEKRPFFLEGIDILDSPLTAIYTRSITDPAWGARGTHRGGWDGVLLTTRDDGGGFLILPGAFRATYLPQDFDSQATIGRLRKPVGDFTFGAVFTDRRTDDDANTVAGPDLSWRLGPGTRINAQWLASRTDAASGNAANLDLLHEGKHWRAALAFSRLDDGFRADNGYIPQVGIRQLSSELRYRITDLPAFAELAPYVNTDTRETLAGERVSSSPHAGVQATRPNNLVFIAEARPLEQIRLRSGGALHELQQGYVSLTAYPGTRLPVLTLSALVGEAVDFTTDRKGRGETYSASVLWRPIHRLEIQPGFDLTTVRTDAFALLPPQTSRESAAQLLTTLHLTARDRFRLIAQRLEAADDTVWLGSLLFTHERSLTRRIYAGVSYARSDAIEGSPATLEVFLKLQWGWSPGRGLW